MLVRQLRRNFVLLNHSQQRFDLLQKLYEPYELIYDHKQSQSQMSAKLNVFFCFKGLKSTSQFFKEELEN